MSKRAAEPPKLPALAPILLLSLSLAESLLAVYQWMELVLVRSGGTAVCALSETLNCAAVWSSPFASRLHALFGMPVAGLGLVWGLAAFGASALLAHRAITRAEPAVPVAAVRLTALVGLFAVVSFAVASFRSGALCLTCLGTYALVIGFAVVALRMLPGKGLPAKQLKPALLWTAGLAVPAYLLLLYPGLKTPDARGGSLATVTAGGGSPDQRQRRLVDFIEGLSWAEKQAVADSMALYQRSPVRDGSAFAVRQRFGEENAAVRLVEWADVRCGHCRALVEVLSQLKRVAPPGSLSVEPRQFPLDSECNGQVQHSDGTGIRCLAAKAQICLEGSPDYWKVQEGLFSSGPELTREKVLEIASSGSLSRERLEACVASEQTQRKLEEDLAYAALYSPRGTPLVVVNGREGTPVAAWLYAMTMSGGQLEPKVLASLPEPRP